MESARQYAAERMDTYSSSRWGSFGTISEFAASMLGTSESEVSDGGQDTSDKSGGQTSLQDSADAIRARYEAMKANLADTDRTASDMYMEIKAKCLNFLINLLFGIKRYEDDDISGISGLTGLSSTTEGGEYSEYHYYAEAESTTFSTEGTVITEDGRQIGFGVNVSMSREFVKESRIDVQYGTPQYCDPLVIQMSGNVGEVSDQTFSFDLDCDGVEEKINRLVNGSGFLAVDKNDDGLINNGSELFGAKSGNGFADLEQYEADGNGWIDENDDIFSRLKIWTKDQSGNDMLIDLKNSGVGAICLKNSKTDFSVNNVVNNETQAKVRRTGFYLNENGTAGTIQQFDLVKHAYA